MTSTTTESRYFELLGRAYEIPLESTGFESFLDAAHDYFCADPETGKVAEDVARFSHEGLEDHTSRLERIFDVAMKAEAHDAETDTRYHSVLRVAVGTMQVHGNEAAIALLGCDFPRRLSELPFDHEALNQIREILSEPNREDLIVLARVREDNPRPCLALVQPGHGDDTEARISLSFIHWSDGLIERLGSALGLTESETEVLQGHLDNKTPREIAEERGRSPETVKVQAKTILRKTGCARMTDVVRLAASISYLLRKMPDARRADLDDWATPVSSLAQTVRDGRSIAYYRHGPSSAKTTVLFSHALIQGPFFAPAFLSMLADAGIRLLAPSRPGYGYSDPPRSADTFEADAVADALAVLESEQAGDVHVVGHQLGTSHAFRIANALGARARSLIFINGGIPLDEKHYASMDRRVRFAAMATRHAPAILKMANALGIRSFKKKGVRAFLTDRYARSEVDMRALLMPGVMDLHAHGTFHACEQEGLPFFLDEKSKHSDWSADALSASCRQYWLQPEDCSIVDPEAVREFVGKLRGARFETEPGAGAIMLYQRPERVAHFILDAISDTPDTGRAVSP
ncbi:alpha/beta fold hydrolase [Henriciella barbarensis]|uniref:Alpha/beta fold hydrolase n=1 Tax=Henriciella barbarensis TaxID=86342 RepID=A0A399R4Q9_9PROT|nr:alpha/beta fold hydrolase [Henriciella barbarensis]RIJ24409.1 alpha/beta fold hydrolase [Henriciella barbarensis]